MVTKEGGVVRGGCEVVGLQLQKDGKKIDGVVLKSGEVVKGDIILVCFTFHCICSGADDRLPLELGTLSIELGHVLIPGHLPFAPRRA